MKEIGRTVISTLIAVCVFFLLYFGLKWPVIVSALLCVGVYSGLYLVLKPTRKIAGRDVDSIAGGREMQAILDDAQSDLDEIAASVKKIRKPETKASAAKLHDTGTKILKYLLQNPDKLGLARQFFNYDLDTAKHLLARYVEIQNMGVVTKEIGQILEKIEQALPQLEEMFEQQFTQMMSGELLDVQADIAVLENMKKMGAVH